MSRFAGDGHALVCALVLVLVAAGCGKFQQARECATFVKTVNAWLEKDAAQGSGDASLTSDPKQIAEHARRTAQHYTELSQRLAALHVEGEDLAPRVQRYEQIADSAALALRDVADALDHGDLEKARQKRVEFDTVAQREAPLVKEINGVCR
ncbi:MAG TPA: hypothetical protein VFK05_18615 [Polyangiaceae bacterium]|nr:hypothetical protein [Polyangiaceae bacterium]